MGNWEHQKQIGNRERRHITWIVGSYTGVLCQIVLTIPVPNIGLSWDRHALEEHEHHLVQFLVIGAHVHGDTLNVMYIRSYEHS